MTECCIFHKKRAFGESSSESGEDSSDDERRHHKHCSHGKPMARKKQPAEATPPSGAVSGPNDAAT